ncbi:MAG: helix-turn-helix domain-containing protein [Prevotella sp.]|nr:helix-turn-helix domain-containing protein [Prevotella sp.]
MWVTALWALPTRFFDANQLSSNLITSLCQDQQGYIWIGTEYGLNRFDGAHVRQYYNDESDPKSIADDIVRQVFVDRDGCVWIISDKGVQRYNRLTDGFERVRFAQGQDDELKEDEGLFANVNDILQTPEGKIWVLNASRGVYEVSIDKLIARPIADFNKGIKNIDECDNMFLDGKGRLWVSFRSEGFQLIDTKSHRSTYYGKERINASHPLNIIEDAQHRLTIVTYTDVLQLNERTMEFESVVNFPRMSSHRLYKGRNGQIYLGTLGGGVYKVNLSAHEIVRMEGVDSEELSFSTSKVHAFLEDRDGNKWLGLYQKGLMMVSPKETPFHFMPLSRISPNNDNMLRFLYAGKDKSIYVCQEKSGINVFSPEGEKVGHMMGDHTVMTITEDKSGQLLVGTFRNGMFRIAPGSGREEWMPQTGTQRIGSIALDKQGNIYTAVFNEGLFSYTPDGKTPRSLGKGKLNLHNIYINKVYADRNGLIWIGHYYGIDVYDPKADCLVDVKVPDALRPAVVYAIEQSPKDNAIWIGTNKGLFRYGTQGAEKGQWKRFTTSDGLPNNIVCGIVITKNGTLWASTYRGLAERNTDGTFTRYYRGNGLQEWSYLRGVYAWTGINEVVLGSQNGITYFAPDKITKNDFKRGITLTGMRLGDSDVNGATESDGKQIITKPLDSTDEITVSYLDNTFSLRFSSMDFRDPQNVSYEYRFTDEPKGVWHSTASGASEIFLSHLSVGVYKLHVRAYDNGAYSPEKILTITVSPPWYRSWGAYMFYLMLLLAIASLWWRNYWNKRQAETNEEKIKFFVDLSHELRSPLTLIKSPLEKLLREDNSPATTRALLNIHRNTNRLLTLTNQILSIRKIEKGQMKLHFAETAFADFIENICHDYDYQVEKRHITLTFDNQTGDMKVWIDRDNFDKVVTNLIGNAMKYVEDGGKIDVVLRRQENSLAGLTVRDNGPGIDEAQLKKIFERFYQASARPISGQISYGIGLNLTQKIVTMHGGSIVARNRTDEQGAEFIVRLPLGCAHLPKDQLVVQEPESETALSAETAGTRNPSSITQYPSPDERRHRRTKTSYRVVVVDDDEEICNFLKTELGESYHVETYHDGQTALKSIIDKLPDLVISDVVMPNMNGYELLKRLKSSTQSSHIPVILLTTKTAHQSRIEGFEQGADAYMDKPFNLEELEARVAGLIANRIRVKGKFSGVQEQEESVRKIELKGNDAALMEKIMKTINEQIDDSDFNVESLADAVGLSRVQLHRRVKEMTGITVGEFIRNLRLQQAARLLAAGDTTVAQVTYAVGFANPTHFASAFKKHFGVTPSDYMAKKSKENE